MDEATSARRSSENLLDERLIERCEAIPERPEPGQYVVIDTMHFSNTVIELLAKGAAHIHITDERGNEFSYRERYPDAVLGGGSTDEYEPADGYDFFNSPSYVQRLDVDGSPVSMTSSNGGRAVACLRARAGDDVDVFVGSTMNAAALGEYLRGQDGQVHLVSSGSKGEVAVEDHIGATLVSRYLDGVPVSETELDLFRRQLETAKGHDYTETHDLRRRDVREYAMNVNSRDVLPKLVGDSLVDVSVAPDEAAAEEQAAD
ncbi:MULTISPECIES: 2-phosphosulfolactate phosphatase [Salinibaculum]|uniref:2-phosphosulfolactate phosphatase n=1 Tax=Salinibaculum TaxID=2732368 RepID=UPI0030D18188